MEKEAKIGEAGYEGVDELVEEKKVQHGNTCNCPKGGAGAVVIRSSSGGAQSG